MTVGGGGEMGKQYAFDMMTMPKSAAIVEQIAEAKRRATLRFRVIFVLTWVILIGGLAFVLPCLLEIKMSPVLMRMVYGMSYWGGTLLGGYRPMVFFWAGLELGMWMTAASLAAECSALICSASLGNSGISVTTLAFIGSPPARRCRSTPGR